MIDDVISRSAPVEDGMAAVPRLSQAISLAAMKVAGLVSKLLDAFVDILEPLFTRFASQARWIAVMEADGFSIYEVRKGHPTLRAHGNVDDGMAEFVRPGRGSTIELRLPQDQVLHRTLRLPAAGRNFLERIVEHRLERLTPWNPEKVLYGFRIVGEEGSDGTITVAFAATSSDIVAEPVRRLQKLGLLPTALGTAAEPIDAPLGVDLYRGQHSAGRSQIRRSLTLALSAVAIVLAPACLASFWLAHASETRLRSVEERLAKARARLPVGAGAKAEQARGRDRALIETKRPGTSIVVLIDVLGSALPSNTFLRELDIDLAKVRLVGRSDSAPALIGLLEAQEALVKVQFAAPVIRDSENRDDFEIVATRVTPKSRDSR
jgi:general secretion pathway protein L